MNPDWDVLQPDAVDHWSIPAGQGVWQGLALTRGCWVILVREIYKLNYLFSLDFDEG